jgi:hypothetical protein
MFSLDGEEVMHRQPKPRWTARDITEEGWARA